MVNKFPDESESGRKFVFHARESMGNAYVLHQEKLQHQK